MATVTYFS